MSADYWSFVFSLQDDEARALGARLDVQGQLGDVLGPDEQSLHRFPEDGEFVDLTAAADAYGEEQPPYEYLEPAYVRPPLSVLEDLPPPLFSSRMPSIVALDRSVAIPLGIPVLRGRALRVVSSAEMAGLREGMLHLRKRLGHGQMVGRVAQAVDRSGNGTDDAVALLAAVWTAIDEATESRSALLLCGAIAP